MKTTLEQVKEFHHKFVEEPGLDIKTIRDVRPTLIKEEFDELIEAINCDDRLGILDALTDLQYVLDGTYIAFGLDHVKEVAFAEVHRSNMSKLGRDGKPIFRADGKVLKGDRYSPPNLGQFI